MGKEQPIVQRRGAVSVNGNTFDWRITKPKAAVKQWVLQIYGRVATEKETEEIVVRVVETEVHKTRPVRDPNDSDGVHKTKVLKYQKELAAADEKGEKFEYDGEVEDYIQVEDVAKEIVKVSVEKGFNEKELLELHLYSKLLPHQYKQFVTNYLTVNNK